MEFLYFIFAFIEFSKNIHVHFQTQIYWQLEISRLLVSSISFISPMLQNFVVIKIIVKTFIILISCLIYKICNAPELRLIYFKVPLH